MRSVLTMSRWVNAPPRMKTEDESPQSVSPSNEFPPQDSVTYIPPTSFNTIKKQVGNLFNQQSNHFLFLIKFKLIIIMLRVMVVQLHRV